MIIPIYGKIKNVPNHQPVLLMLLSFGSSCRCHPSDRHDCCTKNALAPPLRPPEVASWGPGSHISDPGPAKTELGATQMCRRVQLHGIVMGYGGMVIPPSFRIPWVQIPWLEDPLTHHTAFQQVHTSNVWEVVPVKLGFTHHGFARNRKMTSQETRVERCEYSQAWIWSVLVEIWRKCAEWIWSDDTQLVQELFQQQNDSRTPFFHALFAWSADHH